MMTNRKNDELFEDDFLGAMRALEADDAGKLAPANSHKQIARDMQRSAAARSGDAEACAALGIHLCPDCGGTGKYRGVRVHQVKSECFPCRGKGYFMTSYADRMAARAKAAAKANERQDRIRAEIDARSPGMAQWLAENSHWCNIAASVLDMLNRGKEPTERQIEAVIGIRLKTEKTRQEKAAAREAQKRASYVEVDLTPIRQMFEVAIAKGAKAPTYRAEGVMISLAKANSVNAGMLYVKAIESGVYGGKLDGVTFKPTRDGQAHDFAHFEQKDEDGKVVAVFDRTAAEALAVIAENPLEAAIRHGRQTGYCACCGKLLVNDSVKDTDGLTSVARGIGPVCGRKMGLIP